MAYKPKWRRDLEKEFPEFHAVREMVLVYMGRSERMKLEDLKPSDRRGLLSDIASYTVPKPQPEGAEQAGDEWEMLLVVPGSEQDREVRVGMKRVGTSAPLLEGSE